MFGVSGKSSEDSEELSISKASSNGKIFFKKAVGIWSNSQVEDYIFWTMLIRLSILMVQNE